MKNLAFFILIQCLNPDNNSDLMRRFLIKKSPKTRIKRPYW